MIVRAILLAALAPLLAAAAAAAPGSLEYPVKAAFLPKFASYVSWQRGQMRPGAPFTVCVVGDDPFGSVLDQLVAGQSVEGAAVTVRRVADASGAGGCQIAYVAGSARQPAAAALKALAGEPMLTVTDDARSSARGVIHYVVRGGRVRFHIDAASAARHGLAIRSPLLALALSVKTRGGA